MVSPRYADVVDAAESELSAIGNSLHPEAIMPADAVPWALLARATSLFDGPLWLSRGPSDAAGKVVLRSLADLAILVGWLRLDPDLHPRLWTAESWRRQVDDLLPNLERRGHADARDEATEERLEQKRSVVDQARSEAIAAGVVKKGSRELIPSMRARAKAVGTSGAADLYELLVGHWSEWTHSGAESLPVDYDNATSSIRFDEGPPGDPISIRSLACAIYAYILADLSRWLDLAVHERCDELRGRLVAAENSGSAESPDHHTMA